ncbi:MAG: glycosyltransferase family 4 protein [Bacteroidetes bacterium]|nr:glycosyltransferase family 4 protein [Bacteroidota bacterium]
MSSYVYKYLRYFGSRKDYNLYFITNGGDALSRLDKLKDVQITLCKFSTGIRNVFYSINFYKFLIKYCINNNIDIIHSHHRFPEYVAYLVSLKINVKTVTSALSFVSGYKKLSFKSDKIISCSNSVSNMLINYFKVSDSKIFTTYHCVEEFDQINSTGINRIRRELNIGNEIKVILYVGRINKVKGYDILINSYLKNFSYTNNIKLILIGGIEEKSFSNKINRYYKGIIHLSPSSKYYHYYELADVVISPSRKDPFPLVMLETGIMKKPFIGSRTGGISEFIDDGVNGFLFEPGNADDLADKIKFVINNPEKAKSAAEELHKKVKKYCNCEDYFARLKGIYEELLEA